MTRNWIATASRTLGMVRSSSVRPRRRRANPRLENLEARLSLSNFGVGRVVSLDLNPQPLPPGYMDVKRNVEIVGQHIGVPMIQGQHIGTAMIQGNHIGTNMVQRKHVGMEIKHGNGPIVVPADDAPLNPQPIPPGRRVPMS
jgi:hypothetical protein